MKNDFPSDLRHYIDVLGGAANDPQADPDVVMKCCTNIAMAVADVKKPLPDDIFAPGINEHIARHCLSAGVMTIFGLAHQRKQQLAQKSK